VGFSCFAMVGSTAGKKKSVRQDGELFESFVSWTKSWFSQPEFALILRDLSILRMYFILGCESFSFCRLLCLHNRLSFLL
jgi:hypothetical protein